MYQSTRLRLLILASALVLNACSVHPAPPAGRPSEGSIPAIEQDLRTVVDVLANGIGERTIYRPGSLDHAAEYIEAEFRRRGLTAVRRQAVPVSRDLSGLDGDRTAYNIEGFRPGDEDVPCTVVIGAHYDTKVKMSGWHDHSPALGGLEGTPGANDNASGVAALLSLISQLQHSPTRCALRFVAFANEEPPFYQTDAMGSVVYARALAEERLSEPRMISLETLGCYSPRLRKKRVPGGSLVGLPDSSDYVALLSDLHSRAWAQSFAAEMAKSSAVPVRAAALPAFSRMVAWSDDWAFWKHGIPAFAITDTAFMRHDDYHELNDTAEGLDYVPLAAVVFAIAEALKEPQTGSRIEASAPQRVRGS